MRILFIWPGIYMGWGNLGKGFENSAINHGLSSLSAVLKDKGHICFLMDMRGFDNWEKFEAILKEQKFDLVVIGFHSVDKNSADRAIRLVKNNFPDKPVIAGGVHITFNQLQEFSLADTVVWGEGDEVITELVAIIEGKLPLPRRVIAKRIKNLDKFPFVDRNLFNYECEKNNPFLPLLEKPFYTVNFSRGCPFACSFCLESKNLLWKGQVLRSPEKCIEELVQIKAGSGEKISSLMIHDDIFPSREWCLKFIDLWDQMLSRIPWWCQMRADWICKNEDLIPDLSRLGMTWVSLGIEGSQKMLDFYNKRLKVEQIVKATEILHNNQINIFGNYIMGSPTENEEDITDLGKMLEQIRPEHHSASTYTAYPGSKLYDYCVEHNLLVGDGTKDNDYYSLVRYPYERKIVGIDYEHIKRKQEEFSQHRSPLRQYIPKPKINITRTQIELKFNIQEIQQPKVSIILTSHNRPQLLTQAINSIFQQTIPDWELLIIDDFSSDPNVDKVLKQAKKDPRVRTFRTNYDVDNIATLWNLGMDQAQGWYISFLDDDNCKKPAFCEEMAKFLDNHLEFSAVSCFNEIFQGNAPTGKIFNQPKSANIYNIRENNYIDSGCMMIRKEIIDRIGWFDERLRTAEDWDYVIRIMLQTQGFGIVEKPLANYRWHDENRMYRSTDLGFNIHKEFITNFKNYDNLLKLLVVHQDKEKITLSQNNVLTGFEEALKTIPYVEFKSISASQLIDTTGDYDLVLVFMPFSLDIAYMEIAKKLGQELVTFHCEDPQALGANLERAKYADYVFTNDISVQLEYQKVVGIGNCGYCPSISLNDIGLTFREKAPKRYDVVFFGYAYDSRVQFIKGLLPYLKKEKINLTLIGGGWQDKGIDLPCLGELSEQKSLMVLEESRIVICRNRRNTDLGGNSSSRLPQSVVRGYFECGAGSLIMLDDERKHHGFNDEIIFYSDYDDLLGKIGYYLKNEKERTKIGRLAKQRALKDFTYKVRLNKLLNSIRSKRYYAEIF